jgi:hypothetical protein
MTITFCGVCGIHKEGQSLYFQTPVKKKLGNKKKYRFTVIQVAFQNVKFDTSHILHIPSNAKTI